MLRSFSLLRVSHSHGTLLCTTHGPTETRPRLRNIGFLFPSRHGGDQFKRNYNVENKESDTSKDVSVPVEEEIKKEVSSPSRKRNESYLPGAGEAPPLTTWRAELQYGRILDWRAVVAIIAVISAYMYYVVFVCDLKTIFDANLLSLRWYRFDDILKRYDDRQLEELENLLSTEQYEDFFIKANDILREEPKWSQPRSVSAVVRNAVVVGVGFFLVGDWEKCINDIRAVIEMDKLHEAHRNTALTIAGRAFLELNANREALECVEEALITNPDSLMAWQTKAEGQKRLRDFEGALKSLDEVQRIDPKDSRSRLTKASIFLDNLSRPRDALPILHEVVAANPYNLDARLELIRAKRLLGDYQGSLNEIENSKSFGESWRFYIEKANILIDLKRPKEALEALDSAAFLNPGNSYVTMRKEALKT